MQPERLKGYLGVFLFGLFLFPLVLPSPVSAGSPICGRNPDDRFKNNVNPVASIEVRPYIITGPDGRQTDTPVVGGNVVFDSTPRDSSRTPTNSDSGEPSWTFSGPATAVRSDCFQPKISITGQGTITATISLNGVQGSATITVGQKTTPGGGTGGPIAKDPSDEYCAYKDKSDLICITSSISDEKCTETPECKGKTCTRVSHEQCSAGGAALDKALPLPVRNPSDLGPLIGNFYLWSIGIVGLLVFLVFFQAGFTWLVTAAGDPGKIRVSQDRMWNAVLGAILLFSAYVILRTINPDLVGQRGVLMPGLPVPGGRTTPANQANPLPVTAPK